MTTFVILAQKMQAATGGVLYIMVILKLSSNLQENNCAGVSFLIKLQILKKEIPGYVHSFDFCKIFKNTFFHRAPIVAAS